MVHFICYENAIFVWNANKYRKRTLSEIIMLEHKNFNVFGDSALCRVVSENLICNFRFRRQDYIFLDT